MNDSRPVGDGLGAFHAIARDVQIHNDRIDAERERRSAPEDGRGKLQFFDVDRAITEDGKHWASFTLFGPFAETVDGVEIKIDPLGGGLPPPDRYVFVRSQGRRMLQASHRVEGRLPQLDVDLDKYHKLARERKLTAVHVEMAAAMADPMYPQLFAAAVASGSKQPLTSAFFAARIWAARHSEQSLSETAESILKLRETP